MLKCNVINKLDKSKNELISEKNRLKFIFINLVGNPFKLISNYNINLTL